MFLTYRYQLQPSKRQRVALTRILEDQRQLYNAALEERIGAYRSTGRGRSLIDQIKSLTVCRRELLEMAALPVNLQRWTLKRLDDAYAGFFRRVKSGGAIGFPRFRSKGRWDSFGFLEFSGIRFDGNRLRFKGLPSSLRVHLHRPLPKEADIRSCVFRRCGQRWYVCFQIAVPAPEKGTVGSAIGVDLGLKAFVYYSDGVSVAAPQFSRRAEKEMRRKQRALARCKRGSARRAEVKARLARAHTHVANQRRTWLHQQSRAVVNRADLIAVEDLNVKGLARGMLAKSVHDVSWATFIDMVAYKAEGAGRHLVKVDPRNTSQRCSGCGELVPKSLAVRTHSCPHCGLVIDRDWNASLNILAAVVSRGERNVTHQGERARGNLSLVLS